MTTEAASVSLDLKGLLCPIPVVKVAQAFKDLQIGSILQATATDPGVLADIPAWVRTTGNELISIERADKVITFQIKRVS